VNSDYREQVLPPYLDESVARITDELSESPQLLERFPIAKYAQALAETDGGYKFVPPDVRDWSRIIAKEFGGKILQLYHQLLLLQLMLCFDELALAKSYTYPDSVLLQYRKFFANIVCRTKQPVDGEFVFGTTGFDKDLGICSQTLIPCGAQLVDRNSGIGPGSLIRSGPRTGLSLLSFLLFRIGGFKPLYQMHMDVRLLLIEFNPAGWNACYRRIGELLELDPRIKGVCGSSWWFDPRLAEVSPRLAFLHEVPTQHGARVFPLGSDETSIHDALRNSPERTKQFEEGKYLPKKYMMVWGRDNLLAWIAA
jgi:hypothetical protein